VDDDGDALSTSYAWTLDGAASSHSTDTVASSDTSIEQTWTVTVTVDDGDVASASNTAELRIWPGVGDIIVTEFMPDPDAAADARGEMMEITNLTEVDISLDDHSVEDLDWDCVDLSGLVIPAGDTVVLCSEDDSSTNGGITTCDHEVTWGTGSTTGCNQLALANSADEIVIVNLAGTLDQVVYDSSWVTTGAATGLDPDLYDPTSNDDLANYCDQVTLLSGGDAATPGAENDACD